jgi:hypothetical protein
MMVDHGSTLSIVVIETVIEAVMYHVTVLPGPRGYETH